MSPLPNPPNEPLLPIDSCQALITNALIDAGIAGIDEAIEQPILNRAFIQLNWLLATWAAKRWLVYRLEEYSIVSTGALTYTVGLNQNININPRPDRLEYAFVRLLGATGGVPVDLPVQAIESRENYSRIAVKSIGTLPWRIYYDPAWPIGILFPWPVPQASIYELHVLFKTVLPRFQSLQQPITFPPNYEAALNWNLVQKLRAAYQMPADPGVDAIARDYLNSLRLASQQMAEVEIPYMLRKRSRAYNPYGDN